MNNPFAHRAGRSFPAAAGSSGLRITAEHLAMTKVIEHPKGGEV